MSGIYFTSPAQEAFFDLPGEEISKSEMQLLIMSKVFGKQVNQNDYQKEFAELDSLVAPVMRKIRLPKSPSSAYLRISYPTLTVGQLAGLTPELVLSVDELGNPKVIESFVREQQSKVSLSEEQQNILEVWLILDHIDE